MSRKHFEAMARRVRAARELANMVQDPVLKVQHEAVASALQAAFLDLGIEFNSRFDAARFEAACQP